MSEEDQTNNSANAKASRRQGKKQNRRGPRTGGNRNQKKKAHEEAAEDNQGKGRQQQPVKRKNRQRQRRGDHRPWRKHIPQGTMDPITLEELSSLTYPPFALYAAGPYLPVPEWPPKAEPSPQQDQQEEDPKLRERKLLQEQWGASAAALPEEEDSKSSPRPIDNQSFNLFDGRALAYYMVSQLQFIDPLNRRDLTREELVHLDRYLSRNGFDANVVEAYDTKGISLSMAGAASTTAAGRAQMLQEEAQVLLNSFFRPSVLAQQYNRYQQGQEPQPCPSPSDTGGTSSQSDESDEDGWGNAIYGSEDGGMMVVDDDQNPSMRGDMIAPAAQSPAEVPELFPALTEEPTPAARPNNLWSGHRITGNHSNDPRDGNFPLLATTKAKKGGAAKSKEATGAQRERKLLEEQWGARSAALRKGPSQPIRPSNNRCTGGASASPWGKLAPLNAH